MGRDVSPQAEVKGGPGRGSQAFSAQPQVVLDPPDLESLGSNSQLR